MSSWLNDARALANPDIAIVLVGNKIDLTAGACRGYREEYRGRRNREERETEKENRKKRVKD